MQSVVYATRRSKLALAQSRALVAQVQAANPGIVVEELQVVTTGDRITDRPLQDVGGKGLFVKEIEEAMLAHRADIAIHSMKDVPNVIPPGLGLSAIPRRADPRDVLIAPKHAGIDSLPRGARVGTSSLRRAVCLRRLRSDLEIVPLRGNVDTRLAKVQSGALDAIVLARAGLARLGLEPAGMQLLDPELMLPAVGQGALAIESRLDDERVLAITARVHDPETSACVAAERGVMEAVEGDCRTPMGAHARPTDQGTLRLVAFVAEPDGSRYREGTEEIVWPADDSAARAMGLTLGARLASA